MESSCLWGVGGGGENILFHERRTRLDEMDVSSIGHSQQRERKKQSKGVLTRTKSYPYASPSKPDWRKEVNTRLLGR